jgi:hypothetical protein
MIFDRTGRIDLDWGPISLHLAGRAVFFLWVTLALLALAGIAVYAVRLAADCGVALVPVAVLLDLR